MAVKDVSFSGSVDTELSDFSSQTISSEVEPSKVSDGEYLRLREKLKLRCSPGQCQVRWVKSKGAILALLWNCLTVDIVTLLVLVPGVVDTGAAPQVATVIGNFVQAVSLMLLYPFTGWLADVFFGRYRVISVSLWLMWAGLVATAVSLCIKTGTGEVYTPVTYLVFFVGFLAMECGIAGFKANIVAYGSDQLIESSGNELSAYIHWFTPTAMVAYIVTSFPYYCIFSNPDYAILTTTIAFVLSLSVALCLNFYLKDWLVIEPATINPIKLIYQVLNYARKNKHPRFRSAFTYHVDKIPSRLEMAKSPYGGPFTTEQVEDVKTFLQVLYVLLPASAMVAIAMDGIQSIALLSNHITSIGNCTSDIMLDSMLTFFSVFVILPVYEFIIYPLLHNFIPSILVRIGIGFLFYIAAFATLLAIDTVGHVHLADSTNITMNDTCLFSTIPSFPPLDVSNGWLALPCLLLAFGVVINISAIYEFVLAQSPYSMKGLLMGLIYGLQGIYFITITILQIPFQFGTVKSSVVFPSCSSIYFLVLIVLSLALLVWYMYTAHQYKKRERDPPERLHTFVEEYYDKYLN